MKCCLALAAAPLMAGGLGASRVSALQLTTLHTFDGQSGGFTQAGLTNAADGFFYGVTNAAPNGDGGGTVFKLRPDGSGFAVLHAFPVLPGKSSTAANADGTGPVGGLTQGSDGTLYGTTYEGGAHGEGVIFKINPDGSGFQVLYNFSAIVSGTNADGANPDTALLLSGGVLYGGTRYGGTGGQGVVFKVSTAGTGFQTLHSFSPLTGGANADGANPTGLVQDASGILYGAAGNGGVNGEGDVFKIHTDGSGFLPIYNFQAVSSGDGSNYGGAQPNGPLVKDGGDNLFGPTSGGGAHGGGTVFLLKTEAATTDTGGTFAVLHDFGQTGSGGVNTDGTSPIGKLNLTGAGVLFGATQSGGAGNSGTLFAVDTAGHPLTTLYAFTATNNRLNTDGAQPNGGLVVGTDNAVYGTAYTGGANGIGDVFQLGAGVQAGPTHVQVLWDNTNGQASVWSLGSDSSFAHHEFGPFAGWTANAVSDGPDGTAHLLWTNANGQASVWNLSPSGSFTSRQFGPIPNWSAVSLSTAPTGDGSSRLLWDKTDGTASLWNLNTVTGLYAHSEYGPASGWTARQTAMGPDAAALLWTNTNGMASGTAIRADGVVLASHNFGPYAGWAAQSLSVGPDDLPHLLWDNTNGTTSLWSTNFATGSIADTEYPPASGWTAKAIATGPDNVTHILWNHAPDNAISLWSVTGSGFTHAEYPPAAGWSAVALSAGP